jgi:hypothetical protein
MEHDTSFTLYTALRAVTQLSRIGLRSSRAPSLVGLLSSN